MWKNFWLDAKGRLKLNDLLCSPLFWSMAALKILSGMFLGSGYFSALFFPFFENFADTPFQSPYVTSWHEGEPAAFPYPAFMLYFMVAPRLLMAPFGAAAWPLPLKFLLYHIPLFAADLTMLLVFIRWFHGRSQRVILLLWCSPVLFYISYIHGQLDVVPIALLTVSLYLLFREYLVWSAIILGLGLATKTHLVMTLPFFLLYIWRHRERTQTLLSYVGLVLLTFGLVNMPFLFDHAFRHMVFENLEQKKIGQVALRLTRSGPEFYAIPAAYILLVFYALRIKIQNRDIFIMFLGFAFGVMLLFINPMPGWYYWVVPFLVYFFSRASMLQCLLLAALQFSYLLYFGLSPASDYREVFQFVFPHFAQGPNAFALLASAGFNARMLADSAFTLMQTLLIANCLWIYWRGIKALHYNKFSSHSFLIGIAGDSGSGKSTLTENLLDLFTPSHMTALCGDDMHKWQRGHAKWKEYTHLNPKGNELHQELHYIAALRQNMTIFRRHYDHTTGKFTEAVAISPKPLMVMEGLHTFLLKPTRSMLDLKIFMAPDETLLLHWKIQRDMLKRGYSMEQIIASVEARRADAERYVKVQAHAADIVFTFFPLEPIGDRLGDLEYKPAVGLRVMLSNRFYLDPLLDGISDLYPQNVKHYYECENWQIIEFMDFLPFAAIEHIGEKYVSDIQDFGIYAPAWKGGWEGVQQIIVAYIIFHDGTRFPEF